MHVVWGTEKHAHYQCVNKPAKFTAKSLFSCQGEKQPATSSCRSFPSKSYSRMAG